MQYLHQLGLVHKGLKPENLLLDASPAVITAAAAAEEDSDPNFEVPRLKIADFGLSKHKSGDFVSHCADLFGTLNYMAPECINDPHHISEKADIWSVGLVLYELVSLQRPFQVGCEGLMGGTKLTGGVCLYNSPGLSDAHT